MKLSIDLITARKVTNMVLQNPFVSVYEVAKEYNTCPKVIKEYLKSFDIVLKDKPLIFITPKEPKLGKYRELVVDIAAWKLNEVKYFERAKWHLPRVQSVLLQRVTSYNEKNGTDIKIRTRTDNNKLTVKRIK